MHLAQAALDLIALMVADGERLSLGCMVAAIIARKSFPEARFHFAVPADAPFILGLPEGTLEALEVQLDSFHASGSSGGGEGLPNPE